MTDFNKTTKNDYYNIDPRRVVVINGFNSRTDFGNIEELAAQIKEQGMLNPITVIPQKDDNGNETYRLVDGERRYRAVMLLLSRGVDIARIKALFLFPKGSFSADQRFKRMRDEPALRRGQHCIFQEGLRGRQAHIHAQGQGNLPRLLQHLQPEGYRAHTGDSCRV